MDDSIDDCNRDVGNESRIQQQRGNSGEVLCNFLTIPSGGGNGRRASSGTVIRWLDAEECNANCSGGNVSIPIHPPTGASAGLRCEDACRISSGLRIVTLRVSSTWRPVRYPCHGRHCYEITPASAVIHPTRFFPSLAVGLLRWFARSPICSGSPILQQQQRQQQSRQTAPRPLAASIDGRFWDGRGRGRDVCMAAWPHMQEVVRLTHSCIDSSRTATAAERALYRRRQSS